MTPNDRAMQIVNRTPALRLWSVQSREVLISAIEQAINAAVEAEREACAKIAIEKSDRVQSTSEVGWGMRSIADSIAAAIRARATNGGAK